jgi:molybdopterin converting factor small subunit
MNTEILLFGSLAERFGERLRSDLPEGGCTISELRAMLGAGDPALATALFQPGTRASADQQIVREEERVFPGQEIAFFPVLSGG